MKKLSILILLLAAALKLNAQESTPIGSDSIVPPIVCNDTVTTDTAAVALLPNHYLITKRLLWGEKGLIRQAGILPLTAENRELEMTIRYRMNQGHQLAGLVSLAGMIGSGITGQKVYRGDKSLKGAHETFTGLTNVTYFTSLGLELFSPPGMKDRSSGLTSLNVHKALSIVHVTSMLATNILAGMIENRPDLVPYHRAAAITAFSSLLVATVVIKL